MEQRAGATAAALDYRQLGYLYLSPRPGAEYAPRQTRHVLVRFSEISVRDVANLATFIRVTGATSGDQAGQAQIAADGRTVVYTMAADFAANERVAVSLAPEVGSGGAGRVEPYEYQFMIGTHMAGGVGAAVARAAQAPTGSDMGVPADVPMAAAATAGLGPQIRANGVSVPSDFPQVLITVNDDPAPGYVFLENAGRGGSWFTMMLDNHGDPVYYRRGGGRDFKVQRNGLITWVNFVGYDQDFNYVGSYGAANGHVTDDHELQVLEEGGYLIIGYHDQSGVDLTRYLANANTNATVRETVLQEFTAAGELILQFRAWDHFDIREVDPVVENPRGGNVRFSHMNAIDVDTDGHLLVSSRHINEVTKIDRDTGEIIWRLSGARSDFRFVNDPLNGVRAQHHIRSTGTNRYLIFDNGNGHSPPVSRAVEYELDLTNLTATVVWEFRDIPDVYTHYMGSAERLPNGHTLINWVLGRYAKAVEADAAGVKCFEMNLSPPADLYRVHRHAWTGKVERPYLLVEPYPDNVTLLFNKFGDEAVDYYRIYGGTDPAPTTLLAVSKTTLKRLNTVVNGARNYFRVTAVSSNGVESSYSNEESLVVNIVKPGENMVLNGDFAQGSSLWAWSVSGTASAGWQVSTGVAFVDIMSGGSQLSDVQLRQVGIKLLQGREYVTEFEAWSPQPRVMEVRLGQDQSPFAAYKVASPSLTPTRRHFTYPFVMVNADDLNARLAFNMGASTREVYLDNIAVWMVIPGDFNRDRCLGYGDLAALTSQWLQSGAGLSADLNGDGLVDFRDYAVFAENWSGDAGCL